MPEIVQSATFSKWLSKLTDRQARARILARIDRLAMGNPGDVKPVGQGISEMRIDYGRPQEASQGSEGSEESEGCSEYQAHQGVKDGTQA